MSGKGWPRWTIVALLAILAAPSSITLAQEAEGWAISPGEVRVDGIRLGESTSVTITVINSKDFSTTFSMSSEIPPAAELRPGYEQIPDTGWITFTPQRVKLDPHSRQKVTATVAIPSTGDWGGRSYECWLRATSEAMGILQVELDCRLLLSINPAYAKGIDWVLMGAIVGGTVVAGGVVYSHRRNLKRWLGGW